MTAPMSEAGIIAYLKRAPVPKSDGLDAERIAKKIAADLFPSWVPLDAFRVVGPMQRYWLPRTTLNWDDDKLFDVAEEAKKEFEKRHADEAAAVSARRKVAAAVQRKAREEKAAAERHAAEERAANAQSVKKLMEHLPCSERHAQRLLKQGTCAPERARQMAEALGGDYTDYLRAKSKTGRPPELARLFMRVWVDGLSFRDFIEEGPELDALGKRLADAFALAYAAGETIPDHFKDFEALTKCARSLVRGLPTLEASESVWRAFKLYRVEGIASAAVNEIDGDAGI